MPPFSLDSSREAKELTEAVVPGVMEKPQWPPRDVPLASWPR
jgi:hypothetical protein